MNFEVRKSENSFTLVELLVVIGILAILTAAVVIALNPAELLKQARDSQRIQDLDSIDTALSVLEATNPSASFGTANTIYVSVPDSSATCANLGLPSLPSGWSYGCVASSTLYDTDGTGWIPVNFASSPSLAFSKLPIDPTNTTSTGNYYTYTTGGSWELTALMESDKHDAAIYDGGMYPGVYQAGSHIDLTPGLRDNGLVGYWDFNEGSGTTAYDRSGNGNNGTLTNGPTYTTGKVGSYALSFDGVNDYVSTGDVLTQPSIFGGEHGSLTIIGWINPNSSSKYNMISINLGGILFFSTCTTDCGTPGSLVSLFRDVVNNNTNIYVSTPSVVGFGSWTQIALIVENGSGSKIYINGYQDRVNQNSNAGLYDFGSDSFIGGNYSSGTYFQGLIDDVRVYNRALSASEIQAIYNATK